MASVQCESQRGVVQQDKKGLQWQTERKTVDEGQAARKERRNFHLSPVRDTRVRVLLLNAANTRRHLRYAMTRVLHSFPIQLIKNRSQKKTHPYVASSIHHQTSSYLRPILSNVLTPTTATPIAARTIPPAATLRSVFFREGVIAASATRGLAKAAADAAASAAVTSSTSTAAITPSAAQPKAATSR